MARGLQFPPSVMRRICVLEPDVHVAEALRRAFRGSSTWDVTFVRDEAEAVMQVHAEVLICDARAPDAEDALNHFRVKSPTVLRMVIAAKDESPERLAHLQAVAHHTMPRAVAPSVLFDFVERNVAVIASLNSERLRTVLGQVGDLPPLPATYSKLSQMAQDPDVSMSAMAMVVERDPAMTAALLRTINSAYFGLPRRVATVSETVRYLGIGPLKNLVLTVELFEGLAHGRHAVVLQQEALLRAYAMRELLGRTPLAEAAFMLGVLSDVGSLLLVSRLPIDAMAIEKAVDAGRFPWDVEAERLGCTCAALGAKLLTRWNLPREMIEAVALRNELGRPGTGADLGTALQLVHAIEWSHRAHDVRRSEFRKRAESLIGCFPGASMKHLGRYFGAAAEAA